MNPRTKTNTLTEEEMAAIDDQLDARFAEEDAQQRAQPWWPQYAARADYVLRHLPPDGGASNLCFHCLAEIDPEPCGFIVADEVTRAPLCTDCAWTHAPVLWALLMVGEVLAYAGPPWPSFTRHYQEAIVASDEALDLILDTIMRVGVRAGDRVQTRGIYDATTREREADR